MVKISLLDIKKMFKKFFLTLEKFTNTTLETDQKIFQVNFEGGIGGSIINHCTMSMPQIFFSGIGKYPMMFFRIEQQYRPPCFARRTVLQLHSSEHHRVFPDTTSKDLRYSHNTFLLHTASNFFLYYRKNYGIVSSLHEMKQADLLSC